MSIIIGQEAITPEGLGRVTWYGIDHKKSVVTTRYEWIQVRLYHNEQCHRFKEDEVELIDPRK